MIYEDYVHFDGNQRLLGHLSHDEAPPKPRPAVLVVHDWSGRNAFALEKARVLAEMGYVAFAVDVYGEGRIGETNEEKTALMQPFLDDRAMLQKRLMAAFDTVSALPMVDASKIAVIGFCFGGLCALDLARSGVNLAASVGFHAILKSSNLAIKPIKSKVLVLHGYDDPMVRPQDVTDFCDEMTRLKVDWQVQMYGNTQHAFMNPQAQDAPNGLMYEPQTATRAWRAMTHFFEETLR